MKNFEAWKTEVLRYIRFFPDRGAIARELEDHYEDSVKDFIRVGYDEKLAEVRALQAMGDAEEVGRAMDRAHRPWLGRLWQVSWIALLLSAMFAVAFTYEYQTMGMLGRICLRPQIYHENVESMPDIPCPEGFESGIYTYSFQRVEYFWDGWGSVTICMNAYTPRFWMKGPDFTALTATDSLGRTYLPQGGNFLYADCGSSRVNIPCVIQVSTGDEWPEWVDITHETAGWSFRIELPREGGSL